MDKSNVDEILRPVSVEQSREREEKVRGEFWSKFNNFAARLPFAADVAAAYFCAVDPDTPIKVRGTLFAALAYFIMPIDMIPDILAVVGFTDDIAILTAALSIVSNHITDKHRDQARDAIEQAKTD